MSADAPLEPSGDDAAFQAFYVYLAAAERRDAPSRALQHGTLMRAEQLAQRSFRAIQRQVIRIRTADLTDPDAAWQATMDAQFLIAGLWLLRRAACLPAANEAPPGGPLTFAIALFDAELPDLADLYQSSLGVAVSGIDHVERTDTKPRPDYAPTVEAISHTHYQWAAHTLHFDSALTASGQLTLDVHAAAMRMREP